MKDKRKAQYSRKLNVIYNGLSLLSEWIVPMSVDEFVSDIKTRYAIYKVFQEVVEAAMDICAMIMKDIGEEPKDDYSNVEYLSNENIISKKVEDALINANHVRNWIIHKYNKLDDRIIYERILDMMDDLEKFAEEISKWLEQN
ncbi:MAG: type VII toxin-antitoxin system HepT family RNase toxin [Candidatus Asgardarchaeia archaeon]